MATVANVERVERMRRLGRLSAASRVGNSQWGKSMNGKQLVQKRWKPWRKPLYDMTTFPFKLKPEYRD